MLEQQILELYNTFLDRGTKGYFSAYATVNWDEYEQTVWHNPAFQKMLADAGYEANIRNDLRWRRNLFNNNLGQPSDLQKQARLQNLRDAGYSEDQINKFASFVEETGDTELVRTVKQLFRQYEKNNRYKPKEWDHIPDDVFSQPVNLDVIGNPKNHPVDVYRFELAKLTSTRLCPTDYRLYKYALAAAREADGDPQTQAMLLRAFEVITESYTRISRESDIMEAAINDEIASSVGMPERDADGRVIPLSRQTGEPIPYEQVFREDGTVLDDRHWQLAMTPVMQNTRPDVVKEREQRNREGVDHYESPLQGSPASNRTVDKYGRELLEAKFKTNPVVDWVDSFQMRVANSAELSDLSSPHHRYRQGVDTASEVLHRLSSLTFGSVDEYGYGQEFNELVNGFKIKGRAIKGLRQRSQEKKGVYLPLLEAMKVFSGVSAYSAENFSVLNLDKPAQRFLYNFSNVAIEAFDTYLKYDNPNCPDQELMRSLLKTPEGIWHERFDPGLRDKLLNSINRNFVDTARDKALNIASLNAELAGSYAETYVFRSTQVGNYHLPQWRRINEKLMMAMTALHGSAGGKMIADNWRQFGVYQSQVGFTRPFILFYHLHEEFNQYINLRLNPLDLNAGNRGLRLRTYGKLTPNQLPLESDRITQQAKELSEHLEDPRSEEFDRPVWFNWLVAPVLGQIPGLRRIVDQRLLPMQSVHDRDRVAWGFRGPLAKLLGKDRMLTFQNVMWGWQLYRAMHQADMTFKKMVANPTNPYWSEDYFHHVVGIANRIFLRHPFLVRDNVDLPLRLKRSFARLFPNLEVNRPWSWGTLLDKAQEWMDVNIREGFRQEMVNFVQEDYVKTFLFNEELAPKNGVKIEEEVTFCQTNLANGKLYQNDFGQPMYNGYVGYIALPMRQCTHQQRIAELAKILPVWEEFERLSGRDDLDSKRLAGHIAERTGIETDRVLFLVEHLRHAPGYAPTAQTYGEKRVLGERPNIIDPIPFELDHNGEPIMEFVRWSPDKMRQVHEQTNQMVDDINDVLEAANARRLAEGKTALPLFRHYHGSDVCPLIDPRHNPKNPAKMQGIKSDPLHRDEGAEYMQLDAGYGLAFRWLASESDVKEDPFIASDVVNKRYQGWANILHNHSVDKKTGEVTNSPILRYYRKHELTPKRLELMTRAFRSNQQMFVNAFWGKFEGGVALAGGLVQVLRGALTGCADSWFEQNGGRTAPKIRRYIPWLYPPLPKMTPADLARQLETTAIPSQVVMAGLYPKTGTAVSSVVAQGLREQEIDGLMQGGYQQLERLFWEKYVPVAKQLGINDPREAHRVSGADDQKLVVVTDRHKEGGGAYYVPNAGEAEEGWSDLATQLANIKAQFPEPVNA